MEKVAILQATLRSMNYKVWSKVQKHKNLVFLAQWFYMFVFKQLNIETFPVNDNFLTTFNIIIFLLQPQAEQVDTIKSHSRAFAQ